MASLKNLVKAYKEDLMDGIQWVVFWKNGRSWHADTIFTEIDDDNPDPEYDPISTDTKAYLQAIYNQDNKAIILNGYYSSSFYADEPLAEWVNHVRYCYESQLENECQVKRFLEQHEVVLTEKDKKDIAKAIEVKEKAEEIVKQLEQQHTKSSVAIDIVPMSLKELLECDLDLFQLNNIRIVYFQQEGNWSCRHFILPAALRDITTLKWIESIDQYAVAMHRRDFIATGTNNLVSLDEMASIVTSKHKELCSYNNIHYFSLYCEKEKQQQTKAEAELETPKRDITQAIEDQKFLDSEVGAELIENVLAWDKALAQGNEEKVKECITYWRGMQAALKYFTGVNYHLARTKMSCGISKENEYWLFKIR